MSSSKSLPKLQVDGISFLGGGVRCATSQYAFMCVVMQLLKLQPEELFYKVKYISGNSGAAFTIATLLYYPLMKDIWPLDKVQGMTMAQAQTFYKTYWIDALKKYLTMKFPGVTGQTGFAAVGLGNLGLNSWMNALATYAIAPFADRIGGTKWKDMPFSKNLNMVVSLGATTLKTSSMRSKAGVIEDLPVYLSNTNYTWSKTWPAGITGLKGFPVNLIYGYNNTIYKDPGLFNGDLGTVTYTAGSSPASTCDLDLLLKWLKPKQADDCMTNPTNPITINHTTAPYRLTQLRRRHVGLGDTTKTTTVKTPTLGQSQIGESVFMAAVAASSSFIGCNPELNSLITQGSCADNFVNYDQPVMFDFAKGKIIANTADQEGKANAVGNKYPVDPVKDNGTLDLSTNDNPTYLNLCDGTDSYDNTGIIPMIVGFQAYEKDPTARTYTIFYVDGVDPGDQSTYSNTPSFGHFAKLFSQLDGAPSIQAHFGLTIFDADCTAPTYLYTSKTLQDSSGGDITLKLFYYDGLTTIQNDYCGVRAGIKINLIAMTPLVQLDTKYKSWDDLDVHADVNSKLMQLMNTMNDDNAWVSKFFTKPKDYGCDKSDKTNYQCKEGLGSLTLTDCQKSCQTPKPTLYGCDKSDQTNWQCKPNMGKQTLADCQKSCQTPKPTTLYGCDKSDKTKWQCKPNIGKQTLEDCQKSCQTPKPPKPHDQSGLTGWQITLIVVACVIVLVIAIATPIAVKHNKKRKAKQLN